jgi:hypothetical protein
MRDGPEVLGCPPWPSASLSRSREESEHASFFFEILAGLFALGLLERRKARDDESEYLIVRLHGGEMPIVLGHLLR